MFIQACGRENGDVGKSHKLSLNIPCIPIKEQVKQSYTLPSLQIFEMSSPVLIMVHIWKHMIRTMGYTPVCFIYVRRVNGVEEWGKEQDSEARAAEGVRVLPARGFPLIHIWFVA